MISHWARRVDGIRHTVLRPFCHLSMQSLTVKGGFVTEFEVCEDWAEIAGETTGEGEEQGRKGEWHTKSAFALSPISTVW